MVTDRELRDAKLYARIENPTIWHMRELISLYIKASKGISVRVEADNYEKLHEAFEKSRQYFNGLSS